MVIVLIRRCVQPDKEAEFLASYKSDKPKHPDFIDETLTKLKLDNLPESMRSLRIGCENCLTYLNVARWRSAKSFEDCIKPRTMHDPEIECSDRLRAVFESISQSTMAKRKQLYILIGMAGWICTANLIALGVASECQDVIGRFVATSFALCLPALLFGGILLWRITNKDP